MAPSKRTLKIKGLRTYGRRKSPHKSKVQKNTSTSINITWNTFNTYFVVQPNTSEARTSPRSKRPSVFKAYETSAERKFDLLIGKKQENVFSSSASSLSISEQLSKHILSMKSSSCTVSSVHINELPTCSSSSGNGCLFSTKDIANINTRNRRPSLKVFYSKKALPNVKRKSGRLSVINSTPVCSRSKEIGNFTKPAWEVSPIDTSFKKQYTSINKEKGSACTSLKLYDKYLNDSCDVDVSHRECLNEIGKKIETISLSRENRLVDRLDCSFDSNCSRTCSNSSISSKLEGGYGSNKSLSSQKENNDYNVNKELFNSMTEDDTSKSSQSHKSHSYEQEINDNNISKDIFNSECEYSTSKSSRFHDGEKDSTLDSLNSEDAENEPGSVNVSSESHDSEEKEKDNTIGSANIEGAQNQSKRIGSSSEPSNSEEEARVPSFSSLDFLGFQNESESTDLLSGLQRKSADSDLVGMKTQADGLSATTLIDSKPSSENIAILTKQFETSFHFDDSFLPMDNKVDCSFKVPDHFSRRVNNRQTAVPKQDPSQQYIDLMPGKKWRRTLATLRHSKSTAGGDQMSVPENRRFSIIRPSVKFLEHRRTTILKHIDEDSEIPSEENAVDETLPVCNLLALAEGNKDKSFARSRVLELCQQTEPIKFSEVFPKNSFLNCKKIGEGVYGEVFMLSNAESRDCSVLKIIPIEGDQIYNGEIQKEFGEVLSELYISVSLSNLKKLTIDAAKNWTENFCDLISCKCVMGKYPTYIVNLWNEFRESKGSENDSPTMFKDSQLYSSLEMAHGGEPLESHQFSSARQAYSIVMQVVHALAVAERELEFEHRDLHWGNILVAKTKKSRMTYKIDGEQYLVATYLKKATIIDFTLSRMQSGHFDFFNDIGKDEELFMGQGDLQFQIYRDMREDVHNEWHLFRPKTNVRWVHYLAMKCANGVYYRNDRSTIHERYIEKLTELADEVLLYDSAYEFVKHQ